MKSIILFFAFILGLGQCGLAQENRVEKDQFGEKKIPSKAYYGIHSARAMETYQISATQLSDFPELIEALAIVKLAAARSNADLGLIDRNKLSGIEKACLSIVRGNYHNQFKLDLYQGGAGASTNAIANEVIANVVLEMMGQQIGDYESIPPSDLNISQSHLNVYPTAIKVAFVRKNEKLLLELEKLADACHEKGMAFSFLLSVARVEMQDAYLSSLGQSFLNFSYGLKSEISQLAYASTLMYTHHMSGNTIEEHPNTPSEFPSLFSKYLGELTHKPFVESPDFLTAANDVQPFLLYSAALKSLATRLSKISNDLILMSSGPRAGFHEINLPPIFPPTENMPGTVSPVIPELINQICYQTIGNDFSVTLAATSGQLQANAYLPLITASILESQTILTTGMSTLAEKCVVGITANEDILAQNFEKSLALAPLFYAAIGEDKTKALVEEGIKSGKGFIEIIREKKLLSNKQIEEIMTKSRLSN